MKKKIIKELGSIGKTSAISGGILGFILMIFAAMSGPEDEAETIVIIGIIGGAVGILSFIVLILGSPILMRKIAWGTDKKFYQKLKKGSQKFLWKVLKNYDRLLDKEEATVVLERIDEETIGYKRINKTYNKILTRNRSSDKESVGISNKTFAKLMEKRFGKEEKGGILYNIEGEKKARKIKKEKEEEEKRLEMLYH